MNPQPDGPRSACRRARAQQRTDAPSAHQRHAGSSRQPPRHLGGLVPAERPVCDSRGCPMNAFTQAIEPRPISSGRRRGIRAIEQQTPKTLAIPVPPNKLADVLARRAVPARRHLPVYEGLQRLRQRYVHRAHEGNHRHVGKFWQESAGRRFDPPQPCTSWSASGPVRRDRYSRSSALPSRNGIVNP